MKVITYIRSAAYMQKYLMLLLLLLFCFSLDAAAKKQLDISLKYSALDSTLLAGLFQTTVLPAVAVESQRTPRTLEYIEGTVTDSQGLPLPGVSIVVKGTVVGTVTDVDGFYSMKLPGNAKFLVFSFIGFQKQEIELSDEKVLNVIMQEQVEGLDEVVVVAFGKQKRTDMIGSITSLNTRDLGKISTSNLTTALAGQVAGVISYQRSGEPGQDNADFFVRGVTTFGDQANRSPLILIDGIELTTTDLARLSKDDIASFSVLKDATATALYGARGANGVILVETKQGTEGPAKISLRIENSISTPTREIELADPVTFMEMHNEAVLTRNPLGQITYLPRKIDNTRNGLNPLVYPVNDWHNLLFKDRASNQRTSLNISGGGNIARYYVAGSYNHDNGVLRSHELNNFTNNITLDSYTLRANVNVNVTPTTELMVRLNGIFDDYTGPLEGGATVYNWAMQSNPVLFPAYYPIDAEHQFVNHILFGNFGDSEYLNPFAEMVRGYKDYSRSRMLAQFEFRQDLSAITQGLSFSSIVNTNRYAYFDVERFYNPFYYSVGSYDPISDDYSLRVLNPDEGTENLGNPRTDGRDITSNLYVESRLLYNRVFKEKHEVSGLFVFRLRELLESDFTSLQTSLPYRNLGVSGRATYSFDKRYFAEFNFGYNGSERFHESQRYGFFPSAGIAWTISNEKFWEKLKTGISNLRLRATYGVVGNDAIGSATDRFFYISEVNLNSSSRYASFGTENAYGRSGIQVSRYANPDITWERAYKSNVALELTMGSGLSFQAEYFKEHRTNILLTREAIPSTMGLQTDIKANLGEAQGSGVDLTLDYQRTWQNQSWLSIRGNFTYATNKYLVFEEPDYDEYWRSRIGYSIQQRFGYIAERLFIDDEDAANSPAQNFGGGYQVGGGDIKYTDVNRDGEITEADIVPIGNPTLPEIVYGFGFSYGYKNFDISAFFQGLTNESFWIDPGKIAPFINERQVLKAISESYWSEGNRDIYAFWPRLSISNNPNNSQVSTWFMRDGSFLRLKQLEIGYNLPESLRNRMKMSNFRLYFNASNLLTFSKFDLWDVEMGGNGLGYPIQRTFNFGLNLSFN